MTSLCSLSLMSLEPSPADHTMVTCSVFPASICRSLKAFFRGELGKRSAIERFFGRIFLFFHLQCPPLCGWSEIASQMALTYAASLIVGLAAQQGRHPDHF